MMAPQQLRKSRFIAEKIVLILLFLPLVAILEQRYAPAASSAGEGPQAKITLTSALVVLPVNVTDSNGTFVPGLKSQDFKVFENGKQQDITLFKQEDSPVTVGLIVDHSYSMGPKLPAVAWAVNTFAHSSNLEDEMFVVDFNDNVAVELMRGKPFTHDAAELQQAVDAVSAKGRTALYDAVIEGLIHVELGQWDKRALIIVSDGGDNASRAHFSELLALAQRSHVVIYSVGLIDEAGEEENPRVLKKLSNATGGITFFTKRSDEAGKFTKRIARDLREQYTLGYAPQIKQGSDSFRKISVQVTSPEGRKLHVRTRPGYFPSEKKSQTAQSLGAPQ